MIDAESLPPADKVIAAIRLAFEQDSKLTRRKLKRQLRDKELAAFAESGIDRMLENGMLEEVMGVPDNPIRLSIIGSDGSVEHSATPTPRPVLTATERLWQPLPQDECNDKPDIEAVKAAKYGEYYDRDKCVVEMIKKGESDKAIAEMILLKFRWQEITGKDAIRKIRETWHSKTEERVPQRKRGRKPK